MPQKGNSRGFFTIAQNTNNIDYVRCAYGLALSLKHSQNSISNISIGISPGAKIDDRYLWAFDKIIEIPWLDNTEIHTYKIENEWKIPYITPYDETIKINADMLFTTDISLWWQTLSNNLYTYAFATKSVNWCGKQIRDDVYRNIFRTQNLPNIYSAFSFIKKHDKTYALYELAQKITQHYDEFYTEFLDLKTVQPRCNSDIVMAMALKIVDLEKYTFNNFQYPLFTDMTAIFQGFLRLHSEDWRDHLTSTFSLENGIKIGGFRQVYPLHYSVKEFLSEEIIEQYEFLYNV